MVVSRLLKGPQLRRNRRNGTYVFHAPCGLMQWVCVSPCVVLIAGASILSHPRNIHGLTEQQSLVRFTDHDVGDLFTAMGGEG